MAVPKHIVQLLTIALISILTVCNAADSKKELKKTTSVPTTASSDIDKMKFIKEKVLKHDKKIKNPMKVESTSVSPSTTTTTTVPPEVKENKNSTVLEDNGAKEDNSSSSGCICSPLCDSFETCPSKKTFRRPDCPCCTVCVGEEDDFCSQSPLRPCNSQTGLFCQDSKCRYGFDVEVLRTSKSEIVLKLDHEYPFEVTYSDEFSGNETDWKSSSTKYNEKAKEYIVRGLKPGKKYAIKITKETSFRVLHASTKSGKNEDNESPKLNINVIKKTPSSISLSWDPFITSDGEKYVLEYIKINEGNKTESNKTKIELERAAFATIDSLKPNTKYDIRVISSNNTNEKSDIVLSLTAKTDDGCFIADKTLKVDEKYDDGCEQRCKCTGNDDLQCEPICTGPYLRLGQFKDDPLCFEEPTPDEPCCALVTCSSNNGDIPLVKPKTGGITFAENDAACPASLKIKSPKNVSSCPAECLNNNDCSGENFHCCLNDCGGKSCVEAEDSSSLDLCTWTICGPNAECRVDGTPRCVCKHGHIGYPNDLSAGCTAEEKKGKSLKMCKFKDKVYNIGEEFYDGCEMKCHCAVDSEISCQPRCEKINPAILKDPFCKLETNKTDSCCKIPVCTNEKEREISSKTVDEMEPNVFDVPTKKPLKPKQLPVFDGCIFKNKTYKSGDIFYDGCSTRCECGGYGAIACTPRCPLIHSPDSRCSLQPDPDDSCCKIPICEIPGDINTKKIKDLKILIESITATNASSVRLTYTGSNITNGSIQVWHIISSQLSDGSWNKVFPNVQVLKKGKMTAYFSDVFNLEPGTMHYFKIALLESNKTSEPSTFSNTANIKTFSPLIGKVFDGCFHENNTYEADEEFNEGCEYKCKCNSGGKIQCQDRCTKYELVEEYQHCRFEPSPDDSCCVVPICDNNPDPSLDPLSEGLTPLSGNGQHASKTVEAPNVEKPKCMYNGREFQVKETWEIGSSCLKGICVCILTESGTTKVDCAGGCPHIPEQLTATEQCPNPILVPSNDPCVCPEISCNRFATEKFKPKMCSFNQREYHIGEEFFDGCNGRCICSTNLQVRCQPIQCSKRPKISSCVEWSVPRSFTPKPPNCCPPDPVCINDGSCVHNRKRYANFQKLPANPDNCGGECSCLNGNMTCARKCIPTPNLPPLSLGCPPNVAILKPTLLNPSLCCMMWTCERKIVIKQGFQDIKISPLNATAISIRFILPPTIIGHRGHAEIEYTTNPNLQTDRWFKKRFSRPQSIFDTTRIEYHLSGLRPDTVYYIRLFVISHETKDIMRSKVFRVRMLPVLQNNLYGRLPFPPAALPSDRLPPPKLLPPKNVNLDMKIKTHILSSTSIKVMWRPLNRNEREVISGVKVVASSVNGSETISTLIHQSVLSHIINDLTPGQTYNINLKIVSHNGEPISFSSMNPVPVILPNDKFKMEVELALSEVDSHAVGFKLNGISQPTDDYLNFVQISYQNQDNMQTESQFYQMKADEDVVFLKDLPADQNYKVWANVFLKNGDSIKSDNLLVKTLSEVEDNENILTDHLKNGTIKKSSTTYYTALIVVSIIAIILFLAFAVTLYKLKKKKSNDKALLNKSETAYNNPTYKTTEEVDHYPMQNNENKMT